LKSFILLNPILRLSESKGKRAYRLVRDLQVSHDRVVSSSRLMWVEC